MKFFRTFPAIIFIIAILCLIKAFSLFNIMNYAIRDGDGIGLYFVGFEINDKLRYEQIPQYFWMFLIIGVLLVISSVAIYVKGRKSVAL